MQYICTSKDCREGRKERKERKGKKGEKRTWRKEMMLLVVCFGICNTSVVISVSAYRRLPKDSKRCKCWASRKSTKFWDVTRVSPPVLGPADINSANFHSFNSLILVQYRKLSAILSWLAVILFAASYSSKNRKLMFFNLGNSLIRKNLGPSEEMCEVFCFEWGSHPFEIGHDLVKLLLHWRSSHAAPALTRSARNVVSLGKQEHTDY